MSVLIIRAFIELKRFLMHHHEMSARLDELEKRFNRQFADIHEAIRYLLEKDQEEMKQKDRRRIGF